MNRPLAEPVSGRHAKPAADGAARLADANLRALAVRKNAMREVNECIHRLSWAQTDGGQIGYVCECSSVECADPVFVGAPAYDGVRASPVRFLILPGHERPEAERVVERHVGYTIVENVGEAAEIARGADPRAAA